MSAPGFAAGRGVEIRGLRKEYGDTIALDGLDLWARPGEILGVVGPNGAGKSTMVKILAGETPATAGEIFVDGEPWSMRFGSERVAIVHQEPQLFPNLTVADNIVIGREGKRLTRRSTSAAERAVMADLAIADVANEQLEFVPLATQQRTEIARALVQDAFVFLFDEPNSALTADESEDLFRRMHALAGDGHVVILISHRLAEIVANCARVAVLRDGRCRRIIEGDDLTQEAVAMELVVGHEASTDGVVRHEVKDDVALQLTGWSHAGGAFADVDLRVRSGETVAIVGVEGSGARELVRSIAGFEPARGEMTVFGEGGQQYQRTGYVAADRAQSLFGNLSIGDNLVVRLFREITGLMGALRRDRMSAIAGDAREQYQVKSHGLDSAVTSLSGGNQQKLAIAAAMTQKPSILVLEEPTRGVDVGAKRDIYVHMRQYAGDGHAIVIFCTETTEVFEAAGRVHVMSDGRISAPLDVTHEDAESLAADVTRLERHHIRGREAVVASSA
jgi:ABC-type sugar transport system ATPase subunit